MVGQRNHTPEQTFLDIWLVIQKLECLENNFRSQAITSEQHCRIDNLRSLLVTYNRIQLDRAYPFIPDASAFTMETQSEAEDNF